MPGMKCGDSETVSDLGDTLQEQGRHMQGQQLGYNLQRESWKKRMEKTMEKTMEKQMENMPHDDFKMIQEVQNIPKSSMWQCVLILHHLAQLAAFWFTKCAMNLIAAVVTILSFLTARNCKKHWNSQVNLCLKSTESPNISSSSVFSSFFIINMDGPSTLTIQKTTATWHRPLVGSAELQNHAPDQQVAHLGPWARSVHSVDDTVVCESGKIPQ